MRLSVENQRLGRCCQGYALAEFYPFLICAKYVFADVCYTQNLKKQFCKKKLPLPASPKKHTVQLLSVFKSTG